jgi:hypothetical protein
MKLSRLFMIALLVGTMGVVGCGDDETTGGQQRIESCMRGCGRTLRHITSPKLRRTRDR